MMFSNGTSNSTSDWMLEVCDLMNKAVEENGGMMFVVHPSIMIISIIALILNFTIILVIIKDCRQNNITKAQIHLIALAISDITIALNFFCNQFIDLDRESCYSTMFVSIFFGPSFCINKILHLPSESHAGLEYSNDDS